MIYHISKPSPPLSPYVKQYWSIDNCMQGCNSHIQRIVPNGLPEMMFYFGDLPVSSHENKQVSSNSLLTGQQKGFYDLRTSGKLSLFSVSFQPYAVPLFFNIPCSEFFDRNIPLNLMLNGQTEALESALYEATDFIDKVKIAEAFLFRQLKKNIRNYELQRFMGSIALINKTRAIIDIESLSSSACLSRKQYEREFAAFIGCTPKQFLRTLRFQHSLKVKQDDCNISLTELSYACGYYDQSHMINDYKLMSGVTPSQYFSACDPYSDYFC